MDYFQAFFTQEQLTLEILERCRRLKKIMTGLESNNHKEWAELVYYNACLLTFDEAVTAIKTALMLATDNAGYQAELERYAQMNSPHVKAAPNVK